MSRKLFLLTGLMFVVAGCASVDIKRITRDSPYTEGLRFYRPYPYLLITSNEDKSLVGKIVYLPSKNEEYTIKVSPGVGSVDAKFTLENGWNLTEYGATEDAKTADIITALASSLAGIPKSGEVATAAATQEGLGPGLYMLTFDEKTGLISGVKPVLQFK